MSENRTQFSTSIIKNIYERENHTDGLPTKSESAHKSTAAFTHDSALLSRRTNENVSEQVKRIYTTRFFCATCELWANINIEGSQAGIFHMHIWQRHHRFYICCERERGLLYTGNWLWLFRDDRTRCCLSANLNIMMTEGVFTGRCSPMRGLWMLDRCGNFNSNI